MTLRLFDTQCGDYVDLYVGIALTSASGAYALWDSAVWDAPTAKFGADAEFVDVSSDVRSFRTSRAFSRNLQSWAAGTCSISLDNMEGQYSPDNTVGPYAVLGISTIRPGCAVKVEMTYSGITYPVFYGYITSWTEVMTAHYGPRTGDDLMVINCVDVWGRLAQADGSAVGSDGANETLGARIARILNGAGFTGSTDLDAGSIQFQATDLSTKPVDELDLTAESEGGSVWAEADGRIFARDRYSLIEDSRSIVPQAIFGDDSSAAPTQIPWESIDVSPLDDEMVINSATYQATGGVAQTYQDLFSISLYGRRPDPNTKTDLVCVDDADVMVLAQWAVMTQKDPQARVNRMTLKPLCDPPTLIPLVLGMRVRDLVEIHCLPPSLYGHEFLRYCFISGIHFEVEKNDFTVMYELAPAGAYQTYASSHWGEDATDTTAAKWGSNSADSTGARWFV